MGNPPPLAPSALPLLRERAIERLTDAFAHDRLTLDDYERRLERAYAAASVAQLDSLTTDLDQLAASRPGQVIPSRPEERIVSVMSETKRRGSWTPARSIRLVAVMSETTLDFRDAHLAPGITEIEVTAVMASVRVIVPPGVQLLCEASAIMGSVTEDTRGPGSSGSPYVIRIRGSAFMAEIKPRVLPAAY